MFIIRLQRPVGHIASLLCGFLFKNLCFYKIKRSGKIAYNQTDFLTRERVCLSRYLKTKGDKIFNLRNSMNNNLLLMVP